MAGDGFIRRLMLHVVPQGFKRMRHFGPLAPSANAERLACAPALPGMPAADPLALGPGSHPLGPGGWAMTTVNVCFGQ